MVKNFLMVMCGVSVPLAAQDRLDDQAVVYSLVLRDIAQALASPVMLPRRLPAVVPFGFTVEQLGGGWETGPGVVALSDTLVRELRERVGRFAVCEPVRDQACRGEVRGDVVRLTRLSEDRVDTVEVTVQHTQARAQHDNTVIRPRPLYYWYLLVRDGAGWRIAEARRGTPDLRTA